MKPETIFKNFREYYSLTKTLNQLQKEILFKSLPLKEQMRLSRSFVVDGWEDLFIVNEIDSVLDNIKSEFGVDLIFLRIRILSGDVKKIKREFLVYINNLFRRYETRHTRHIFDGIRVIDLNKDYVLLVSSQRRINGEKRA